MRVKRAASALLAALVLLTVSGCAPAPAAQRLLWADEFDGAAGALPNPSVWEPQLGGGGWGNHELETYTDSPRNLAQDGRGHLVITARRSGPGAGSWTSARVQSKGAAVFRYADVQVRARLPRGTGIWPAAWTLGEDVEEAGWPQAGEIDLVESEGNGWTAWQTAHGPQSAHRDWQVQVQSTPSLLSPPQFHTYGATWSPSAVTFSIDGVTTGVVQRSALPAGATWPFAHPQVLLLDVAVGGVFTHRPDATTPAASSMLVDWVRVYAPAG